MRRIDVPVLIVGGGGCGLSASNFLADLGVESLLVERHPSTAHLPKAHYLNQRTMEIFRQHGLADAVYAEAAPRKNMGKILWCTSLGGDGPLDGVVFLALDALGGGGLTAQYDLKGVTAPTNLPQIRLEPVLRRIAEQRNPGRLLFRHELMSLTQDAHAVNAIVRDLDAGEDILVRANYLIGADGGKTVGPALGIKVTGPTQMADFVMSHISADLSKYIKEDTSVMRIILHPDQVSVSGQLHTGALLTFGPNHWDGRSEEWGVAWSYQPDDPERHNEEQIIPRIKAFLKIDVPIKVHRVSHWYLESLVADKFQAGRVFIAGDAAHKHTPSAGLGLNAAIQDAHNLCWKLAFVLQGKAPPSLLDSYETERRAVTQRNADWSMFSMFNHNVLVASLGLINGAPAEFNEAQFAKLLADNADGQSRRARVNEVFKLSRMEYAAHDMEMGFNYPVGAVVDDASPMPVRDPMGAVYTPSSRPGCRLPHAWLRHKERAVSTHDLLPMGGFLLLTGEGGQGWCAAAQKLAAETGLRLSSVLVGESGGEVLDPSGAWAEVRGVAADGAILVRPDGHVGFRAATAVDDAYALLGSALRDILCAASLKGS
jgi:2,4-dichlorophenol 6-monooxygenase